MKKEDREQLEHFVHLYGWTTVVAHISHMFDDQPRIQKAFTLLVVFASKAASDKIKLTLTEEV